MPSTIPWPDPSLPVPVEYTPEAMEWIRRRAFDGLLALPKVGLGIGGLLLGNRERGGLTISGAKPIFCSHASGPSFHLTASELAGIAEYKPGPGLEIVGCYCSRPRRPVAMKETDEELFRTLCPAPGQLFLMIRPSATEETRAGLFRRNEDGSLSGGAEYPLIPWAAEPEPIQAAEPDPGFAPEPEPAAEPAPEPVSEPVAPEALFSTEPPQIESPSARLFGPPPPLAPPVFAPPPNRGIPWKTLGVIAATVGLLLIGWFTRDQWIPRPPLEMHAAETNGRLSLEWNRVAVRGLAEGRLSVTDGNASKTFDLDRAQLELGAFSYSRQSPEVSAILIAGTERAAAHFKAPPAPAPPVAGDAAPQ